MLNTTGKYTNKSNTLAGNVANNILREEILSNTKGKYTKELNALQHMKLKESQANDKDSDNSNVIVGNQINLHLPSVGIGVSFKLGIYIPSHVTETRQ